MKLENALGIRTVLIVLVLVAMTPVFFVVVYASLADQTHAVERARLELANQVQLRANSQQQLFEGTRHLLMAVAHGSPIRRPETGACSEYLRDVNEHFPHYAHLAYADIDGTVVCRSARDGRPMQVGDRRYFQDAVRTRQFTVGEYLVGRILGIRAITFSLPILGPSGEVKGVQYAVIDLAAIQEQFSAVSMQAGMHDVITDADGVVLAWSGEPMHRVGERLAEDQLLRAASQGSLVTGNAVLAGGQEWLYAAQAVRPQGGSGALLVASMASTESVLASAVERLRRRLLVVLAITLAASLLAWSLGDRLLARPIGRLLARIRRLEQGDYDSVDPPESASVRELRHIDRGISDLSLALALRSRQRDVALAELTEQKQALESSELRYRAQFHDSPQPMWVFDLETLRFLEVNDAAVAHYGYSRQQFLEMTLLDIRPPEEVPLLHEVMRKNGSDPHNEVRTRHWRSDGSIQQVEIASHAIEWQGRAARAVIAYDVTSRALAEQAWQRLQETLEEQVAQRTRELELANRELEAFSYSVSHDLRGPLHMIARICAALLRQHAGALPPEASGHLEQIRASTVQMNALVDDLLSLARTGRDPLVVQAVDVAGIAAGVVGELRQRFPGREVEVELERPLQAFGDPALLKIVLENLIGNAWKFTSHEARPRVRVARAGDGSEHTFVVADNGAGFDPSQAARLFKPFQRLHPVRQFDGTGIGLAIVYRIVHRHGGRVRAESAPGKGARFYVTLPWGEARQDDTPSPLTEPAGAATA